MTQEEEYFYSMVSPKIARKKRPCLKCTITFVSENGKRICGSCLASNQKVRSDRESYRY
jgi:ribosomal protein S27AE